jgi:hypothetical protein
MVRIARDGGGSLRLLKEKSVSHVREKDFYLGISSETTGPEKQAPQALRLPARLFCSGEYLTPDCRSCRNYGHLVLRC